MRPCASGKSSLSIGKVKVKDGDLLVFGLEGLKELSGINVR